MHSACLFFFCLVVVWRMWGFYSKIRLLSEPLTGCLLEIVVALGSPSGEPLAVLPNFRVKSPKCLFRHVVDAPTLWPLDAHCNKRKIVYQTIFLFHYSSFFINSLFLQIITIFKIMCCSATNWIQLIIPLLNTHFKIIWYNGFEREWKNKFFIILSDE